MEPNNITVRNRCIRRCLSNASLDSLDSTTSNNLSVKSMMDLSTHISSDEVTQLKRLIQKLREELLSAHTEIEKLTLENYEMKTQLQNEVKNSEQLRMMCTTLSHKKTASSSTSIKLKRSQAIKPKFSSRRLNLDLEFQTPKLCRNNTPIESTESRDNPETTIGQANPVMLIDGNTSVPPSPESRNTVPPRCESRNTSVRPHCGSRKNTTDFSQLNHGKCHEESGRILMFSDNQGLGIVQTLIKNKHKLITDDYKVESMTKPNAKTKHVLAGCSNYTNLLSKKDHVIIMTGSNDTNPVEFMTEMSIALHYLKVCNVYVINVLNNNYLNESKLNYELKLITRNFKNCTFVEARTHNVIQKIMHHINVNLYNETFLSYNGLTLTRSRNSSITNNSHVSQKISSHVEIKKGTIPYYFPIIKKMSHDASKTNPTTDVVARVESNKNIFFRK